jgi:hypothetical protein
MCAPNSVLMLVCNLLQACRKILQQDKINDQFVSDITIWARPNSNVPFPVSTDDDVDSVPEISCL